MAFAGLTPSGLGEALTRPHGLYADCLGRGTGNVRSSLLHILVPRTGSTSAEAGPFQGARSD